MQDTIASISTALGIGAISIIRVSGKDAISIVNKIFEGKDLNTVNTHTIHYGFIKEQEELIDEVLVSIMKSPKTFTTEDIVEINCHGGITTTKKILELVLSNGARLAEPGEFTKRAFLNGRIDLLEAEAVMDLINVKTESARRLAMKQLQGTSSNLIKELRQNLLQLLASIEVNIDYPEYEDIEVMTNEKIKSQTKEIKQRIEIIIKESNNGKLIKDGIQTAIIGRPNVGKSSILNHLLEENKAIVTDIAGTTRDIVEGSIVLDNILLNIIDTAGIRSTKDIVEKMGVEKSKALIEEADLILIVLNQNEELSEEDEELLERTKNKNHIIVVNKADLPPKVGLDKYQNRQIVYTSTLTQTGLDKLKEAIVELFNLNKIEQSDYNYLTNARGIGILSESLEILTEIELGIENNLPIDLIEIDIKRIWSKLGEIIGETYQDELIDQLFSQFCLGK